MSTARRDQLLQLVPQLPLEYDVTRSLIDCEARSLSQRTVHLCRSELGHFCNYLRVEAGLCVSEIAFSSSSRSRASDDRLLGSQSGQHCI